MNTNIPWIEKYRPNGLDEVISHESKVKMLRNAIRDGKREIPHLLFYGSPGTGKTSLMLALVKDMYGDNYRRYILELNASDKRGIQVIRDDVRRFAQLKSDDLKFIILDEADAMTSDAQDALRRIIEIYSKTCRFCIICNNHSKIIRAIRSRCLLMRFSMLSKESIKSRLKKIFDDEGVMIDDNAFDYVLENNRDFRQILNMMQCLKCLRDGKRIRLMDVMEYLGEPNEGIVSQIIDHLMNNTFKTTYQLMLNYHRRNEINMLELLRKLVDYVIDKEIDDSYKLINGMGEIEYRIINGYDSEIQLASLVALWIGRS